MVRGRGVGGNILGFRFCIVFLVEEFVIMLERRKIFFSWVYIFKKKDLLDIWDIMLMDVWSFVYCFEYFFIGICIRVVDYE